MRFSSTRTLRPGVALLVLCAAGGISVPARADMVDTFNATGVFQGGQSLGGTLTIDTTTGTINGAELTVSGQPTFYHVNNDYAISPTVQYVQLTSPANEIVPGIGFPSLSLLLPSSLVGYVGGGILPQATGTTPGSSAPITYNSGAQTLFLPGPGSLTNGALTLGQVSQPQVVYLDFASNSSARYVNGTTNVPFNKPDSGFASSVNAIVSAIQTIYQDYNVQFTSVKPTAGTYDTIYIGGTAISELPATISAGLDAAHADGVAANINFGNKIVNDSAVVFSGDSTFTDNANGLLYLEKTIAHEAGHTLGLVHVTNISDLLYPANNASLGTTIGGGTPISDQGDSSASNPNVILQDANSTLGCNVGFSYGIKNCSTIPSQGLYSGAAFGIESLYLSTFAVSSALYNATLFIYPSTLDADVGPVADYLGSIYPDAEEQVNYAIVSGDTIALQASLQENGPLVTFGVFYDSSAQSLSIDEATAIPEPPSVFLLSASIGLLTCLSKAIRKVNS